MLLKLGHFGKRGRNTWKLLKCVLKKDGKIIWTHYLKNEEVFLTVKEVRIILHTIKRKPGVFPQHEQSRLGVKLIRSSVELEPGAPSLFENWAKSRTFTFWYAMTCLHFSILLPGMEQGQIQLLLYLYYKPAQGSQVFEWKKYVGKRKGTFIPPYFGAA